MRSLRAPALLLFLAAPAAAQEQAVPPPVLPTIAPTPVVSPTPEPTPAPTAAPVPTPTPRATPAAADRRPPQPRAARLVTPDSAVVAPLPSPVALPAAVPSTPVAPPVAEPTLVPLATPESPYVAWLWLQGVLALGAAVVLVGLILRGRRRREAVADGGDAPAPMAEPVAVPVGRPEIAYRPTRIGLNLLSATVEGEVTVTAGADAIDGIEVRIAVVGVASDHAAAIAAIHRDPPPRPKAPGFALAAGAARTLRVVAAVPRADIAPLAAGGRPIFVPLVVVALRWQEGGVARRRTSGFAVGIERVDSPRLAPVWLDQDMKMHDHVAARPHGTVLD